MGYKICWLGFTGICKDEVLAKFGLCESGQADEANEAPFSGAEIPGGWFVLFVNDFEFLSPSKLEAASADCRLVACQVHEGVMVCVAYGYERGEQIWALSHNAQDDLYDLSILGTPPSSFETIRRKQIQKQKAAAADSPAVDHIFDIPLLTAASVCPYQHDRWKFDWGEPKFTKLND